MALTKSPMVKSEGEDALAGDFDAAYNWFSTQYADPVADQPLLSERETKVFSQFLDTVLTDTDPASRERERARFLDEELARSTSGQVSANTASQTTTRSMLNPHQAAQTEFYRGFVDGPANSSKIPGQLKPRILYTDALRQIPLPNSPLRLETSSLPDPSRQEGRQNSTSTVTESSGGSASADDGAEDETTKSKSKRRDQTKRAAPELNYRRKENLSEDQVRKNHIRSEKKRRDSIKQLFQEMCGFVEGIDVGDKSLPKAAILEMVCEHIRKTMKENQRLRKALTNANVDVSSVWSGTSE